MQMSGIVGKITRFYEGKRVTGKDGRPVDTISFDLAVHRDGADDRLSLTQRDENGNPKRFKCDFLHCTIWGEKALNLWKATNGQTGRKIRISGNLLQKDRIRYNGLVRIVPENPLYALIQQYGNPAMGIECRPDGFWVKGDYANENAFNFTVEKYSFEDYPNGGNNNGGWNNPQQSQGSSWGGNNAQGNAQPNGNWGGAQSNSGFAGQATQGFNTNAGFDNNNGGGFNPQSAQGFNAQSAQGFNAQGAQGGFNAQPNPQAGFAPQSNPQGGFAPQTNPQANGWGTQPTPQASGWGTQAPTTNEPASTTPQGGFPVESAQQDVPPTVAGFGTTPPATGFDPSTQGSPIPVETNIGLPSQFTPDTKEEEGEEQVF